MDSIEVAVVKEEHQSIYDGKLAIILLKNASFFVKIIRGNRYNALVQHPDGSKQKARWNDLLIEQERYNDRFAAMYAGIERYYVNEQA